MNVEINYNGTILFGTEERISGLTKFGNFSKITNNNGKLIAFLEEQGHERYRIKDGYNLLALTTTHSGIFADGTNFSIYRYSVENGECDIYIRINGNRTRKKINDIHDYIVNRLATNDKPRIYFEFNSRF